ncbi:hypothetical protein [Variovorax defluvii]|uniref:hypothetical protein n=1 Tax=Variovorax defluvii TaxID=913761 RepID=UPI0031F028F5
MAAGSDVVQRVEPALDEGHQSGRMMPVFVRRDPVLEGIVAVEHNGHFVQPDAVNSSLRTTPSVFGWPLDVVAPRAWQRFDTGWRRLEAFRFRIPAMGTGDFHSSCGAW